ncbi:MAG: 4-hydroxy-tetrahydrodipicolinate reductase [Gemmataceae bacterium]
MKINLGVNGACGRMGRRIIDLAYADPDVTLAAALEAPDHPLLGRDIGEEVGVGALGLPVVAELPISTRLDVLIDFSSPDGTSRVLSTCAARRIPILVATTGHNAQQKAAIEAAAHQTAVLLAANTSLAVNVLMELVREAAEMLRGRDFDMEILERHHRYKKDSPSGTALKIAQIMQETLGSYAIKHGREGTHGERPHGEIGIHAVRVGDNVGEHTVIFSTLGETLEISHRAHARDCYARGAIQAAKYLADRPAGRYTMEDVLGLKG